MAIHSLSCVPFQSFVTQRKELRVPCVGRWNSNTVSNITAKHIYATAATDGKLTDQPQVIQARRSANYPPSMWSFDIVQSISNSDYVAFETVGDRMIELEEEVRRLLDRADSTEVVSVLELIDDVQRLGLRNLFKNDITKALDKIASACHVNLEGHKTLHETALSFRLLRENGFEVLQDVFERFRDKEGNFKPELCDDLNGMVDLYEASFAAFEEEKLLDEARAFTSGHLQNIKGNIHTILRAKIERVLELPYQRRMQRLEARWYIETYATTRPCANQSLHQLAILNFNTMQSLYYQSELREMSRWWKNLGLCNKLSFARDRCTECYFWALGMASAPHFSHCRQELAKVASFITIIDDVYDVHGTLDELELFTDAVERWDANAVNKLPDYMKPCYLALYSTINDIGHKILNEQGVNPLPYLITAWGDTCRAFLQEAKWSHNKVTPTLHEYLENGCVSASGCLALSHTIFLLDQDVTMTKQSLDDHPYNYHDLLRLPSLIFRLCNDLATSNDEIERGETANSITCYMKEADVSEEEARSYLRDEIDRTWRKLNQERFKCDTFSEAFAEAAMDLARNSQCVYQYGDGHGRPDGRARDRVARLMFEPIEFLSS